MTSLICISHPLSQDRHHFLMLLIHRLYFIFRFQKHVIFSPPHLFQLAYIEGWKLVNLANETFGFNGWSHSVTHQTVGKILSFYFNVLYLF